MLLQTSDDFLNVTDTDSTSCGALECIVSRKVDVDTVLITLPLLVSEESTEGRETKGDGLVSTKTLGVVRVSNCPVKSANVSVLIINTDT